MMVAISTQEKSTLSVEVCILLDMPTSAMKIQMFRITFVARPELGCDRDRGGVWSSEGCPLRFPDPEEDRGLGHLYFSSWEPGQLRSASRGHAESPETSVNSAFILSLAPCSPGSFLARGSRSMRLKKQRWMAMEFKT